MADMQFHHTRLRQQPAILLIVAWCFTFFAAVPLVSAQGSKDRKAPVENQMPTDSIDTGAQETKLGPPTVPVEQIIKQFAAKEAEFRTERDNFTYTQTFVIQTLDESNRVDGEYRTTSDIVFDERGRRVEKVTYAPTPTLERLMLTKEDLSDLENLYPFVLTSDDIGKYDVKYIDHVQLDELTTYVFDVAPKSLEKNQRYFQGRIWVDDKDFQIVKTFGKPVYAKSKSTEGQAFPRFETFRENIEGKYWFPTYTRANENLRFKAGDDVHIKLTVRYENYKRFGVTVRIGEPVKQVEPNQQKK
ncbi:MAG TPA: hypothetical protein VFE02_14205 [Candidatus Acidoferrales bacterium]|jgi:hypothetical protein|nr:hypothetical protein [Candidatus Acidoferrales bacterium]